MTGRVSGALPELVGARRRASARPLSGLSESKDHVAAGGLAGEPARTSPSPLGFGQRLRGSKEGGG